MPLTHTQIRQYLTAFDFRHLFNGLGWDNFMAKQAIVVSGQTYDLAGVAAKRGMTVFVCEVDVIPPYPLRRAIDRAVTKSVAYEHILVFVNRAQTTQVWQWVKREMGRPDAAREHTFHANTSAQALVEKVARIAFTLDEEESLTMSQATGRVAHALDVGEVTKKFYGEFRKRHAEFRNAIDGIPNGSGDDQRDWYASLMLNRLMFVYFIQSKGLLDGDPDYLPNRLRETQERLGPDQFHGFYREFLMRLFHEGLNTQTPRPQEIVALIGDVPYLNGGLFDVHEIEELYEDIAIPDSAFAAVFAFFSQWNWHLDTRPNRMGNEINPDILGYIFEQYINQKEMGAYYTKEDITGYIAKNTIIPFVLGSARNAAPGPFAHRGEVWGLLADNPDKYLYDAVKKGVDQPLPGEIAAGVTDLAARRRWNKPADESLKLPSETWRECVGRRQRYETVWAALVDGSVTTMDDLITHNLDIHQFAQDVIDNCETPALLAALWNAVTTVTVLDPTCGSGAFLFAALTILEPLYDACLERMRVFVEAPGVLSERSDTRKTFEKALAIFEGRDRNYAILKHIIVNNLYGVDIMAEAVEICKLRLFLKLAAHLGDDARIEPLPDIDFNIRAGNTLVGYANAADVQRATLQGQQATLDLDGTYARIREQAETTARAYTKFQEQQTTYDNPMSAEEKAELRAKLGDLQDELDRYLAAEYGIDRLRFHDGQEYERRFEVWQQSHRPFHWWSEFYRIVERGGFDVIIGNPPYVEYSKVRNEYGIISYETREANNLFPFVMERCLRLVSDQSTVGLIVQLSAFSTPRMLSVNEMVNRAGINYISFFECRPGKLFEGIDVRLSIWIRLNCSQNVRTYASRLNRFTSDFRPCLMSSLGYVEVTDQISSYATPKLSTATETSIYRKLSAQAPSIGTIRVESGMHKLYYSYGIRYWARVLNTKPYYKSSTTDVSTGEKVLEFLDPQTRDVIVCIMSSSLFFWYYCVVSDGHNFTKTVIDAFPVGPLNTSTRNDLISLCSRLTACLEESATIKKALYKTTGNIEYKEYEVSSAKSVIDEIDRVLAIHYDFTNEELDFIINYDIKYRMGQDEM